MEETTYYGTRLLVQRGLGLIYLLGFIAVVHQFVPLLGRKGLMPAIDFIDRVSFKEAPSLFHKWNSDNAFKFVGWFGVVLSLLAVTGVSEQFGLFVSMLTWFSLWVLYLSIVNVGGLFYSFGWESMLLEAGFLAIFLGSNDVVPNTVIIWLYRWFLFRVMFGAGLIKIRGDQCWRDLTCMYYHYETQPIPNRLSWYFHWLPKWMHRFSVGVNHFIELLVPFLYFAPQPVAAVAGLITLGFHAWLSMSGNFAFLGFLTMVLSLSTLSDPQIAWFVSFSKPVLVSSLTLDILSYALAAFVVYLSINPIRNLLSRRQLMNYSFNRWHFVGTYGAFGSITRPRYEVIIEGSNDQIDWEEYEFIGKPGDLKRACIQIAPYHLRLDWLIWFAAFQSPFDHPWLPKLIDKLKQNDKSVLKLMKSNPFKGKPPRYVRAQLYRYWFTTPKERRETKRYWNREWVQTYYEPIDKNVSLA
ncbi:MAG: lipase maturation factor family protein [Deltaproteobacteria bacterium]|nr:lipase maturation factor family protein [Deltaproteobacteria bacterium]